jgi:propane 2-monooxygenase small subunit
MTATEERPAAGTPERPPRSVPQPHFTDAEAGAKEFPDSGASARRYNYYEPAKRKQTHYEDVTVEVQPDPRHYLSQGWIYGFADGQRGYPLTWTKLKAWGVDEPEPVRGIGTGGGGRGLNWPAHGWHEFRDPNEEWEQTIYRNNANVVRQLNQNIENARNAKSFEQWTRNWTRFVERSVGAWMHVEHILGLYVFAANERSCPTNMHNTVLAVNSAHKIRFAQDLALYNLTLSEEIEDFDGSAHVDAWNNDTEWQGVREITEALTAVQDDWGEAMFVTNVIFEPLIGELFRSGLVMHAAPGNGDFVTPTVMGAGEHDYAQRDLRWTKACFGPLVHDREFADHNRQLMDGWLSAWVPRVLAAARTMQPLWSEPDHRPPRFEDSLDHAKNRFAGILNDLGLETPKELAQ